MSKSDKKASAKASSVEKNDGKIDPVNTEFDFLSYTYGKSTNISKFKETAFTFCLKELGMVARVIRDGERYHPPAVPDPIGNNPFSAANDPHGAKKAAYLRQISNREDSIAELRGKEPKLFAHLWGNMSKESRTQVERLQQQRMDFYGELLFVNAAGDPCDANAAGATQVMEVWDEVFGNDVLSLIRRIDTSHLAPDTGIVELNQETTRIRYENLKQYPHEQVLDYKRRFQNALDAMTAVGLANISDSSQATRFIINLDSTRFARYKADVNNWAKNNIKPYPRNLEEAYESASTHKDPSISTSTTSGTAYVAEATRGRGKGRGRGRGRGERSGPRAKEDKETTSASSGDSKSTCTKPCPICSDIHWQRNCPLVAQAKALHDKVAKGDPKPKNEKAHVIFSRATVAADGLVIKSYPIGDHIDLEKTEDYNSNDQDIVEVSFNIGKGAESLSSDTILLDNQASVSVFKNVHILSNIRQAEHSCRISGISSDAQAIVATQVGDYNGYQGIYACPDASANILSFSETKSYCDNNYDKDNDVFMSTPPSDKTYVFKESNGLYVYQINQESVLLNTVSQNLQQFTNRERQDAEAAKELSKLLGHPNPRSLIEMINNGSIVNCPVTAKDVARAYKIFGPDLASLRGKTRKSKMPRDNVEYLPREISSDLTLNVDLMFVNTNAFLISVSTPLGLTMVNELGHTKGSRSLKAIAPAMMQQIDTYASRQFQVKTIRTDNEGSIIAMTQLLNQRGIVVNPAGPGSHVPVIERKIQEVKQRARGIFSSLPYKLAAHLFVHLIIFCVSRINLVPHKTGLTNISPTEAFKGRKLDFKRDLRIGFGEYAEAFDPYSDNTMRPRTNAVISLGHTGNISGSVKFLSLNTGKTIIRDQFTIVPIPDNVITHMNKIAELAEAVYKSRSDEPIEISMDISHPTSFNDDEDPTLDYDPDPVITIADRVHDNEDDPSYINPLVETIEDHEQSFDHTLRGVVPNVVDTPPTVDNPEVSDVSTTSDSSPPRHQTRSSTRASRLRWDHRTHQLIGAEDQVMLTSTYLEKFITHSSYNISVKKAIKNMPNEAVQSIYKELAQMVEKKVFEGVNPQIKHKKKVIKSFLFLKEKFKADGTFDKLKSRLVAGGHMQDREQILYEDTNSPTASIPFIMTIASIAAREQRHVKTIDITGAYLNADISKQEIYMELDPTMASIVCQIDPSYDQFIRSNGSIIVNLKKALYGCVESAKLWYRLLSSTLEAVGYVSNPMDPCIFNKNVNGVQCSVVVYVDDLFITSKDISLIEDLESLLRSKFRDLTVHSGLIHSYLGMTWDYTVPFEVKVTMEGFMNNLITDTKIEGIVATPASDNLFTIRDASKLELEDSQWYHTQVAKLLYLAKRTRPDILLAVSFLTTRVQSPDEDDMNKLIRVLKYLNGSKDLGIVLRADKPFVVHAYIDASYGVHDDGKSHSALAITLGAGPLLAKSTKQKLVTKSSTEAELVAESDFASEAICSRDFLAAQGEAISPSIIHQDNMSTIAMIKNGMSKSDRTRHMNVRYFWTKERVDSGDIEIVYTPTDDMIADILTKPLQGDKFRILRQLLLNWNFGIQT